MNEAGDIVSKVLLVHTVLLSRFSIRPRKTLVLSSSTDRPIGQRTIAFSVSIRNADALHKIVEPRIAVQSVEQRMDLEFQQKGIVRSKCPLQPLESRILLS